MNAITLDPVRAAAIERELAAIGSRDSRLRRRQRRVRVISVTVGSVALAGALTGGAILVSNLPGEVTTKPLGAIVKGTFVGSSNVELGEPPADAAAVVLEIGCSGGGEMSVPLTGGVNGDVVSWDCAGRDPRDTVRIGSGQLPAEGTSFISITAAPGTEWTVIAQYAISSTTEWGVNANGQTYGVPNDNGIPDLMSAQATNGELGYIFHSDLLAANHDETINVYAADGTTVIGGFHISDGAE